MADADAALAQKRGRNFQILNVISQLSQLIEPMPGEAFINEVFIAAEIEKAKLVPPPSQVTK